MCPFIIVKYQKCGKARCRCQNSQPHGPYYWLLTYIKPLGKQRRKLKWEYLGKDATVVFQYIHEQHPEMIIENLLQKMATAKDNAHRILQTTEKNSFSESIVKFDSFDI